jgi:hypothetical protein
MAPTMTMAATTMSVTMAWSDMAVARQKALPMNGSMRPQ